MLHIFEFISITLGLFGLVILENHGHFHCPNWNLTVVSSVNGSHFGVWIHKYYGENRTFSGNCKTNTAAGFCFCIGESKSEPAFVLAPSQLCMAHYEQGKVVKVGNEKGGGGGNRKWIMEEEEWNLVNYERRQGCRGKRRERGGGGGVGSRGINSWCPNIPLLLFNIIRLPYAFKMRQDYLSTSYLDQKYLPSERTFHYQNWLKYSKLFISLHLSMPLTLTDNQ